MYIHRFTYRYTYFILKDACMHSFTCIHTYIHVNSSVSYSLEQYLLFDDMYVCMYVGDVVKMIPVGGTFFFSGRVHQLNADGTLDIQMDGDDPEDIERKVPKQNITKVLYYVQYVCMVPTCMYANV